MMNNFKIRGMRIGLVAMISIIYGRKVSRMNSLHTSSHGDSVSSMISGTYQLNPRISILKADI
jgi:xanthine/uracil permease